MKPIKSNTSKVWFEENDSGWWKFVTQFLEIKLRLKAFRINCTYIRQVISSLLNNNVACRRHVCAWPTLDTIKLNLFEIRGTCLHETNRNWLKCFFLEISKCRGIDFTDFRMFEHMRCLTFSWLYKTRCLISLLLLEINRRWRLNFVN